VPALFGPRLLYRFLKDWVTQVTIGLYMATFIYLCLVFLVTHQDSHTTFVPQVSLITSWFLVVGSFGFLVYYSHRIAASIQNPDLVARIVDDLVPAVRASRGIPAANAKPLPPATLARQVEEGASVSCNRSGYVQEIHHQTLVAEASRADAVVHLLYRPGQFVLRGERLASVHPAERLPVLESALRRHVTLGRHRSLKQDSEFAIAQIVEIAIRALSPAVNDTFTGVACVDWLGDALLVVANAPRSDGCWYDDAGAMRVRVRPVYLERLVRTAFDQIRQAAADNPAVLIRILETIRRLAPRIHDDGPRRALRDEADAVREGVASAQALVGLDRKDIEVAWQRARTAIEEPAASR